MEKRIHDLYGECHLEIAGGEPSIYPQFSDFIIEVLNYHTVSIMTNLSGDLDKIINSKEKVKTRFKMGCTFHPMFGKIEEFLEKAKRIRQNGMAIGVLHICRIRRRLPIYPNINNCLKITIYIFQYPLFWGEYNGKQYPDSYTDEEKK